MIPESKELKVIELDARSMEQEIANLTVIDQISYTRAVEFVGLITALRKRIVETFKPAKQAAKLAHAEIVDMEKKFLDPVSAQEVNVRGMMNKYLTEQERIRREAQQKLDNERRAAEEKERKRLASLAEKAEKRGDNLKAIEFGLRAEAVDLPATVVAPVVPQMTETDVAAVSQRKDIVVTITDVTLLLNEVMDGRMPLQIIKQFDMTLIKKIIKDRKLTTFPGLSITETVTASVRTKETY